MGRGFRAERRDWIGSGDLSIGTEEALDVLEFIGLQSSGDDCESYGRPDDSDDQSSRFVFYKAREACAWIGAALATDESVRSQATAYWAESQHDDPTEEATEEHFGQVVQLLADIARLAPEWRWRAIVDGENQLEILLDWY